MVIYFKRSRPWDFFHLSILLTLHADSWRMSGDELLLFLRWAVIDNGPVYIPMMKTLYYQHFRNLCAT